MNKPAFHTKTAILPQPNQASFIMSCSLCQSPIRTLWAIHGYPELKTIYTGNWILLQECPPCNTLWCYVPHEPYSSFIFMTLWPYNETTFRQLNFIDDARILHEWQNAFIRERWQELPPKEQESIEAWRKRTYYSYNPIDSDPTYTKPKYVNQTGDIREYAGF